MAFNRRTINKELDIANLNKHNDNYADIESTLDEHDVAVGNLNAHIGNGNIHTTAEEKTKLAGIATGAGAEGSASDTVIGNRTIIDTTAPTGDSGTLTNLLGWLGNMIKSITGKSSWRTAPATTLEAAKTHADNGDLHTSAAEHTKLAGIETGAEVNQNAFSQVNDIGADEPEDALTVTGGTGITITSNPASKTLIVTATGTATPGAHASSHITGGSDVIPDAVAGGSSGLMSGADKIRVDNAVQSALLGAVDGVATLGATARLLDAQLPVNVPLQTTADITYYVRTDGNDANTGLADTADGAFKTIGKAVSMVPQVVNHAVIIFIGDGTYPENVRVAGYSGSGSITITGNQADASLTSVTSVTLLENFLTLVIDSLTASTTTSDGFTINRCVGFRLNSCRVVASSSTFSGVITYFSSGAISWGTYSNRGNGISVNTVSQIVIAGVAGTGNVIGLGVADGSFVTRNDITLTGTQKESNSGGSITGGVLNPWGDNTRDQRSAVARVAASNQTLSAGTFTKINFAASTFDQLSEYDTANNRFVVKAAGIYLIDCAVNIEPLTPSGTAFHLSIRVNGTNVLANRVGSQNIPYQAVMGVSMARLSAGDYVEVYLQSSVTITTNADSTLTYFHVTRVA